MARRTSKPQSKRSRKQRIADRRRQDELDDVEAGPTLEQIADETGILLSILIQLNSLSTCTSPNISTPVLACAQSVAIPLEQRAPPLRRSPRETAHYMKEGYVCECSHIKRRPVVPPASPSSIELPLSRPAIEHYVDAAALRHSVPPSSPLPSASPHRSIIDRYVSKSEALSSSLFVAEDEPLEVTHAHLQQRNSMRWEPYPTPFPSRESVVDASNSANSHVIRRSPRMTRHYVKAGYVCECPRMRRVCRA